MRTPSTTTISLGDVLLVQVAFTDLSGSMKRPAIVVSNDEYNESGLDAVIVPLTSRTSLLRPGDYRIGDWSSAGLARASVARAKPTTVARRMIERRLGTATAADLTGILSSLRSILG